MNSETRHLLEEAAMAILCVHPELSETSCLKDKMFTDRTYGAIFTLLQKCGRYDAIELSGSGLLDAAERLRNYHLDDREMWENYEEFFKGYEKRIARIYAKSVQDSLTLKLARHEIGYTEFLDSYEKAANAGPSDNGPLTIKAMKSSLRTTRHPISIPGLDKLSERLKLGTTDIVTIGGGPARGKSAFMINLAERFSRNPQNQVIYYNIEMNEATLVSRLVCCTGNVAMEEMDSAMAGNFSPDVSRTMAEIEKRGNIYLVNGMTDIDEICADVLRKKKKDRTMIVFIDYVGLVTTTHEIQGYSAVQDIVKALRVFALRHDLLIVMASQLTRSSTINNTESLYSYADSSEIERSSTHALLLTIPEGSAAYESSMLSQNRHARLINLEISKNRNGGTGTFRFEFDMDRQKFTPSDGALQNN